jgi:hypothetical protein
MPAMGATRKELENSVNPGADPARQGAAATLQAGSSNEGVDYLSNGPQGLNRGLIEGSIGRGAPDAAGQRACGSQRPWGVPPEGHQDGLPRDTWSSVTRRPSRRPSMKQDGAGVWQGPEEAFIELLVTCRSPAVPAWSPRK